MNRKYLAVIVVVIAVLVLLPLKPVIAQWFYFQTYLPIVMKSEIPTVPPDPNVITFTGTGDQIIDFDNPFGKAFIHATYSGERNFIIRTVDENNEHLELLVNTIGSYDGLRAMDLHEWWGHTKRFQVTSSGAWTIVVSPLSPAYVRTCQIPGICVGTGDDLFYISGGTPDMMSFSYYGPSNIIVYSHSVDDYDLLVNEIGDYSGTVLIPTNTTWIEVESSGTFTAEIKTR